MWSSADGDKVAADYNGGTVYKLVPAVNGRTNPEWHFGGSIHTPRYGLQFQHWYGQLCQKWTAMPEMIEVEKPGQLYRFLHTIIVTKLCIPFIRKFLHPFFKRSSESLRLCIPSVDASLQFGGLESENNNEIKGTSVAMTIVNPIHFCWRMVLDQKLGLGEAYMDGDWTAIPNPTELLKMLIRAKKQSNNAVRRKPSVLEQGMKLMAMRAVEVIRQLAWCYNYLWHRFHDNTIAQSAKNIRDHYDLGNDMFELFLDESMTYSCGLFEDPSVPVVKYDSKILYDAQVKKMDALIDMLDLKPTDTVLEIGCGWGATAIRAVERYGCSWTGLTISTEQLEFGRQKVREAGLEDKIDLRYQDYRLADGKYSKVISIEMIEAVGEKFLPQYFQIISDRLESGGIAVLQAITCPDAYYERYCKSSDFIKKHIFPGGHMPSMGAIYTSQPEEMKVVEERSIGRHYATTLDYWFCAWMDRQKEIVSIGYSETFHRKWQFYFALCSSLFAYDHIDVYQLRLQKS